MAVSSPSSNSRHSRVDGSSCSALTGGSVEAEGWLDSVVGSVGSVVGSVVGSAGGSARSVATPLPALHAAARTANAASTVRLSTP